MELLTIKQFNLSVGDDQKIKNSSFSVNAGDVVLLTGPNGCGKSTVIKVLMGAAFDYKGLAYSYDRVAYKVEHDILNSESENESFRRSVCYVSQEDEFESESVLECFVNSIEYAVKDNTKNGLPFRMRGISDILHNPVYCTADPASYQFFLDNGAYLAGNIEDYDGKHALSGYNKNQQLKDEHEDSTFFNPKFTQLSFRKPISEWIISVGKHEPFISSEDWIAAQELMKAIEEQHNRPHRKTNALLSGLMICPNCGKVLNVVSESGRWTRGRPRFKYVCPGHRKKECDYLAVDGVKLDDQVVRQLAALVDEQKDTYFKLIEARIRELTRSDASEREYQETKKEIEKIKSDIAAQIRNLRDADDVLRKFIQDDVTEMSAELSRKESILLKLKEERGDNAQSIEDLSQVKKKLADFKESWKTATPEELVSMIQAVVERVYVVYEDDESVAHIFLKGCIKEDYTSFFDTAGYIPFDGTGVLKVNLCVIQEHENDAEVTIHTQMSHSEKHRELHPHVCRRTASSGM